MWYNVYGKLNGEQAGLMAYSEQTGKRSSEQGVLCSVKDKIMKTSATHKMARLRRNDAGVTLIELTFAAGVLATALGIMFSALITLAVMGDVAEGRSRATTAMSGVMEGMRAAGPMAVLTSEPAPVSCDGHTMAVMMEVFDTDGEPMALPITPDVNGNLPPLPEPMEIRVTLMWEGRGGRTYSTRSAMMMGMNQ